MCVFFVFTFLLISLTILYYHCKQVLKAKKKKKWTKKRKFITPKWALKKAKELERVPLTSEQIENLHKRKPPEIWNNVLIFTGLLRDSENPSTKQLLYYLNEAKTSIYVCMFLCSNYTISNIVRKKFDQGLIVQCVSEYDTWVAHNNKGMKDLAHHGVDVRLHRNGYMMHNKFVIIDEEAVITGSLNWTQQGVESNTENVLVSIDPQIVSKYTQEFFKLLHSCKSWELEVM